MRRWPFDNGNRLSTPGRPTEVSSKPTGNRKTTMHVENPSNPLLMFISCVICGLPPPEIAGSHHKKKTFDKDFDRNFYRFLLRIYHLKPFLLLR